MLSRSTHRGFTLIELLVVVAIIGILAAVLLANFVGIRGRANDTAKKNNLRQIKTALRLWYNDFQRYPAPASANTRIAGCGSGSPPSSTCNAGTFSANNVIYAQTLPSGFTYYSNAPYDNFSIKVTLENASDTDIAASQTKCANAAHSYSGGTGPTDYFECSD